MYRPNPPPYESRRPSSTGEPAIHPGVLPTPYPVSHEPKLAETTEISHRHAGYFQGLPQPNGAGGTLDNEFTQSTTSPYCIRKRALICGIVLMFIGLFCVGLNIALIITSLPYFHVHYLGYGIWGGISYFVAGLLGFVSELKTTTRTIAASNVSFKIAIFIGIVIVILGIVNTVISAHYGENLVLGLSICLNILSTLGLSITIQAIVCRNGNTRKHCHPKDISSSNFSSLGLREPTSQKTKLWKIDRGRFIPTKQLSGSSGFPVTGNHPRTMGAISGRRHRSSDDNIRVIFACGNNSGGFGTPGVCVDTSGGFVGTPGVCVDTSGGFVGTSGGCVDTSGGFVGTSGGCVDTSGGFVSTSVCCVDTSGGCAGTPGGFVDNSGGCAGFSGGCADTSGGFSASSGDF